MIHPKCLSLNFLPWKSVPSGLQRQPCHLSYAPLSRCQYLYRRKAPLPGLTLPIFQDIRPAFQIDDRYPIYMYILCRRLQKRGAHKHQDIQYHAVSCGNVLVINQFPLSIRVIVWKIRFNSLSRYKNISCRRRTTSSPSKVWSYSAAKPPEYS